MTRWTETYDARADLLADLLADSPDGLLHARPDDGDDPGVEPLCVTGGDRQLAGPRVTYVALNLGSPTADPAEVTCPDCLAWMHA